MPLDRSHRNRRGTASLDQCESVEIEPFPVDKAIPLAWRCISERIPAIVIGLYDVRRGQTCPSTRILSRARHTRAACLASIGALQGESAEIGWSGIV